MELDINLKYTLAAGWMQPYITALREGSAVARRCNACDKTSFPPLRVCQCGHTKAAWITLPGDAEILTRCSGLDGDFALVRFSGADTNTVVRLKGIDDTTNAGVICKHPQSTPALILQSKPPKGY